MTDEFIRLADAIDMCGGYGDLAYMMSKIKPADVVQVVHSYWEGEETDCNIKCHKCEKAFKDYIITQDYADLNEYPNFCPNCGAKMDGENKDE